MKNYIFKFKGWFLVTNILVVINSFISVALAFMFKYIIDLASGKDLGMFLDGLIVFGIYILCEVIFEVLLKISKAIYMKKTLTYLKSNVFSHILKKDIKSFTEENSAKYISMLTNDINMIEQDGLLNIFNLVKFASGFIFAFISVIYISIPVTIAILAVTILAMTIPKLFGNKLSNKKSDYSQSLEELTTKTKDILSGFEVIKNFNIFSKTKDIYDKVNESTEEKKKGFSIFSGMVDTIAGFLGTLMFVVPIGFGGYYVLKGQITVGTLIALIQLMNNLANPLVQSVQIVNKIKSLKNISKKISNITKSEVKEDAKYNLESFEESIEFKNVDFSYDGEKKALENINIKFEKGKKYALVGGSGSGKSTILKLLLRYYDEFNGEIDIDGLKHSDILLEDIYKEISVIQQNVFMFDGTIRDNIALYQDYSDKEISEAINLAGLSKLVATLPKGIYEEVGENGCKLSGGEKQRVAIARALMKDSSIMLLDESTSALDNETAYSIEKSLLSLAGVTSIVVTHKLMEDILKKYDQIIAMRDGEIVEVGDFYDLIDKKGYFYSLYYVEEGFTSKEKLVS
ncbi:ABC transporter ATP-binding protein [Dethiothermospora halolimnae]|uniref:ABC transporter ATP-binding protein n=1 Tax=Dethiothermospora halolimnae TaxID=3114390 RepID=UPI003CCC3D50